jgi:hypothetical protein
LTSFVSQSRRALSGEQSVLDNEFEPELGFVRLFLNDAHFRDEIPTGTRTARRPVVRGYGRAGPKQLVADNLRGAATRQTLDQANGVEGE